jgi:hypothetical protein
LRLLLAFIFIFVGWVVTVTALVRASTTTEPAEVKAPATVAESPA